MTVQITQPRKRDDQVIQGHQSSKWGQGLQAGGTLIGTVAGGIIGSYGGPGGTVAGAGLGGAIGGAAGGLAGGAIDSAKSTQGRVIQGGMETPTAVPQPENAMDRRRTLMADRGNPQETLQQGMQALGRLNDPQLSKEYGPAIAQGYYKAYDQQNKRRA